jgi:cytochrome c biogenesis protein CcmG, thiol:disulfide interchange protein DsbE
MAQETPPPPPRRRPLPRLVLVPLALIAAAALVYLATRPLGGGEPQPSFFVIGSAGPGVQIGQLAPGSAKAGAPELALIGIDGSPVSLADFAGRPIWVIFWKTACEPCEAEAADVSAALAAHGGDRLAVIGIDVWDTATVVRDYAAEHHLEVPVAVAQGSAAMDAYGVWGAPTHYFIDRTAIIRDRYFGPMTRELIDKSLGRII